MATQYYLKTINFEKINELNKYLLSKKFKSKKSDYLVSFKPNLENRLWVCENPKIEIRIHNPEYNLFIEISSKNEEKFFKEKLIKNIMRIVEANEIYNSLRLLVVAR